MRLFILACFIVGTVACTNAEEFDRRVNSPDEVYVSELAGRLDAAGIDFRALRDGSLAYRSRDEHAFKSIEEQLKKDIAARGPAKK